MRSTATDLLVAVWSLVASGRHDEARERLMLVWAHYMDGIETEQSGRVALRLFERLAPCIDDAARWASLPATLTVYRAGSPGIAWTLDRDTADHLADEHGLTPLRCGTVRKVDVLAFITCRGEAEIIARPEAVIRLVETARARSRI